MGGATETVNLVDKASGRTFAVPVDQVADALNRGFSVESAAGENARLATEAKEENYSGAINTAGAFVAGGLRGATFGLSDVIGNALGGEDTLQGLKEIHPYASTAGEVVGAIAPTFAAPGSLLSRTPAAMTARLGTRVAELGETAGAIARTGYRAAGAAVEGAIQNGGSYISDVALGDRELSADAFMGAMGKGALWGGAAGGGLSVAADALTSARRLFPKQEMTRAAVEGAEQTAKQEIAAAVSDSKALETAARTRLREIREQAAAQDLETAAKLDAIKIARAQELGDAEVRVATAKAETAEARAAKAKEPKAKRTRKAFEEEGAPPAANGGGGSTSAAGDAPAVREPITVPPGAAAPEDAATMLERQLAGTKSALDAGKSISEIGDRGASKIRNRATHIEDGLNAEIAKVDPEAARLVRGLDNLEQSRGAIDGWLDKYKGGKVDRFERAQATRDYAEGMRPKEAGHYTRLPQDSQRPGFTEGGMGAPRGRTSVWRGSEEERIASDARTLGKVTPEDRLAADEAIERSARRAKGIAEDVGEQTEQTLDAKVGEALRSKVENIDDDVAQSGEAIGQFEAAHADLTEALGPAAPQSAQARAQATREAQATAESSTAQAGAEHAAELEKAADTIRLGGEPPHGGGKFGSILQGAQDIGAALETLKMMGVPVPDPRNIPVVGPLLSAYLKARVLGKAFGRFGGKVAETAETTIASKAARTKQRIYDAVDTMLDAGARGARAAAPKAGGPAAALAHAIFADRDTKPGKAKSDSLPDLYLARADEVSRGMVPGAVRAAVRSKVRASDPAIVDAITAGYERQVKFLDSKMPKTAGPSGMPTRNAVASVPSKAEIVQWSRYVEAAHDPAAVLEHAARGEMVTLEAVETLKTVYPRLYQEAQQRVIERAIDVKDPIPYARRVQLSVMFDLPMEPSQDPEFAAFLQETYKPAPQAQPAAPQMGAPTISAPVQISQRTNPDAEQ